jgi:hypothetical protein
VRVGLQGLEFGDEEIPLHDRLRVGLGSSAARPRRQQRNANSKRP